MAKCALCPALAKALVPEVERSGNQATMRQGLAPGGALIGLLLAGCSSPKDSPLSEPLPAGGSGGQTVSAAGATSSGSAAGSGGTAGAATAGGQGGQSGSAG